MCKINAIGRSQVCVIATTIIFFKNKAKHQPHQGQLGVTH